MAHVGCESSSGWAVLKKKGVTIAQALEVLYKPQVLRVLQELEDGLLLTDGLPQGVLAVLTLDGELLEQFDGDRSHFLAVQARQTSANT